MTNRSGETEDRDPVPAATVVLARDHAEEDAIEVLLVRRNSKLVFHGGHWVFPGGRIDAADFQAGASELEYPAALQAAVRETREEAGIEIDPAGLIHVAHWTTPPRLPRRFSTWFFIYPLTEPMPVTVDNREILDYRWLTPEQALALAAQKQLVLPRPTQVTLEDLRVHSSVQAMLKVVSAGNIRVYPRGSDYYRPREMGYDPGQSD